MTGPKSIRGVLERAGSFALRVDQNRCAKVRNRNVACLKCAEACTSGCITLEEGALVVDAARCVGCGTCATVCPTCALEARNPTDAELLNRCLAGLREGVVTIACQPALEALETLVEPGVVAPVVCAGRVDEALLVGLAAQGARRVNVACGRCEACEQRLGRSTLELVAGTANTLLEAWGHPCRVVPELGETALRAGVTPQQAQAVLEEHFSVPRGNSPVNASAAGAAPVSAETLRAQEPKRTFTHFKEAAPLTGEALDEAMGTFFRKHEKVASAPSVVKVMKDGTLPHFVPDRRERLLDGLAALGEPQVISLATRLWGCVVIDGTKCSSCRMCATFCPTGAISKFDEEDGTFGVAHFPGDCVKCGSCRDVCQEGAITILDNVPVSYLMEGAVHRYAMRPRAVEFRADQIKQSMQQYMDVPIYER